MNIIFHSDDTLSYRSWTFNLQAQWLSYYVGSWFLWSSGEKQGIAGKKNKESHKEHVEDTANMWKKVFESTMSTVAVASCSRDAFHQHGVDRATYKQFQRGKQFQSATDLRLGYKLKRAPKTTLEWFKTRDLNV